MNKTRIIVTAFVLGLIQNLFVIVISAIIASSLFGEAAEPTINKSTSTPIIQQITATMNPTHTLTLIPTLTLTKLPTSIPTETSTLLPRDTATPTKKVILATPKPTKVKIPTQVPSPTQLSYPSNITAICKDGTYSNSKHRSGTCSGHGGVKTWINKPNQ